MKIYHSESFVFPLPEDHAFPLSKYALLAHRVRDAGLVPAEAFLEAPAASDAELALVHDPDYLRRVTTGSLTRKEIFRLGLPWSSALVERARRSCGGTIAACRDALSDGVAVNLAGGTHHAFSDRGGGYCLFNDCAVAVRALQRNREAERVLIIDCDAHQGDGTAAIFAEDPGVFTFSIHNGRNYPARKEISDLDVPLPDNATDEIYLKALETGLHSAFSRADAQLAVYLAGADPYKKDRFGRLALTKGGLRERDRLVFEACLRHRVFVAVTMGGGYARSIEDIVDIHFQTVSLAQEMWISGRPFRGRPSRGGWSG